MLHGQKVCRYRAPKCGACALLDLCPTGAERVAAGKTGGASVPRKPR